MINEDFNKVLVEDMVERIKELVKEYGYEVDRILYSIDKADIVLKERTEL